MKAYVQGQGYDVWQSIMTSYKKPSTSPSDDAGKKIYDSNAKAMSSILNGLIDSAYVKVMHCKSAKEVWDRSKIYIKGTRRSRRPSFRLSQENLSS